MFVWQDDCNRLSNRRKFLLFYDWCFHIESGIVMFAMHPTQFMMILTLVFLVSEKHDGEWYEFNV